MNRSLEGCKPVIVQSHIKDTAMHLAGRAILGNDSGPPHDPWALEMLGNGIVYLYVGYPIRIGICGGSPHLSVATHSPHQF